MSDATGGASSPDAPSVPGLPACSPYFMLKVLGSWYASTPVRLYSSRGVDGVATAPVDAGTGGTQHDARGTGQSRRHLGRDQGVAPSASSERQVVALSVGAAVARAAPAVIWVQSLSDMVHIAHGFAAVPGQL